MRQPSLYAYFDSKLALYDAMFADGNRQLLERLDGLELRPRPRAAVEGVHAPVRRLHAGRHGAVQLLFHRPIPGFEPSPAAYTDAEASSRPATSSRRRHDRSRRRRLFIAMVAGIFDPQSSNDPGGDRWTRHLDRLVDMYLDDAERGEGRADDDRHPTHPTPRGQVIAEEEFRRSPTLTASLTARRVGAAHRLHRLGRAQVSCTCWARATRRRPSRSSSISSSAACR